MVRLAQQSAGEAASAVQRSAQVHGKPMTTWALALAAHAPMCRLGKGFGVLRRAAWLRQAELLLLLGGALLGGGCEALVAAAAARLLAVLTGAAAWKCYPAGSARRRLPMSLWRMEHLRPLSACLSS